MKNPQLTDSINFINNFLAIYLVIILANDNLIPTDTIAHTYRESTTRENFLFLVSYTERKMKTVVIQVGTNSIAKRSEKCMNHIFADYRQLFEKVQPKLMLEVLVLTEVVSFEKLLQKEFHNEGIRQLNQKLKDLFWSIAGRTANKQDGRLPPEHFPPTNCHKDAF